MALDTVRHRLFVANTPNDSLDVVDLTQGKLIKQVPGQRGIHSIAYGADLDVIFVGSASGDLSMFDGRDYRLLKRLHFQGDCEKIRYDPRTQRAYVTHEQSNSVLRSEAVNSEQMEDVLAMFS